MAGHKAIVELLLDHKANLQAMDANGYSPLHLAAQKGFKTVVELLIAHGAEVNAKTRSGSTPLHEAAANGYKSVAELLLAHGANPNADASSVNSAVSFTPLHIAAVSGTPLHIAAVRGDEPMAACAGSLVPPWPSVNYAGVPGFARKRPIWA